MVQFNLWNIVAGVISYLLAILAGVVMIRGALRFETLLTPEDDVELLRRRHRSTAIVLGSTILCEAILLRHIIFPVMSVIRALLLGNMPAGSTGWILARTVLLITIIFVLSLGSVEVAKKSVAKFTVNLEDKEDEETTRDNIAVAVFFAFVLISITLLLNEGMELLARSLIPFGQTGILQ
jgi:uncharacterized membrane protein YjfL (UPF0719 family)